jgi:hypothetical protein
MIVILPQLFFGSGGPYGMILSEGVLTAVEGSGTPPKENGYFQPHLSTLMRAVAFVKT